MAIHSKKEETLKEGITQSEHGFIQWKITGDLLNQFKNAKYKKVFRSPIFSAIGCEWKLAIGPNGFNTEGIGHLQITCNSIESGQEELYSLLLCILSYYVEIMWKSWR
eukprot:119491_1